MTDYSAVWRRVKPFTAHDESAGSYLKERSSRAAIGHNTRVWPND